MTIGRSGNIYDARYNSLVGSHKSGAVYDTSGVKVGTYGGGTVTTAGPAGMYGTYAEGIIYNSFGAKVGSYSRGNIYRESGAKVGTYTGDDEGGAAGGFLLILSALAG